MAAEPAAEPETTRLARQLGEAIATLPEYQTFLDAKEAVEASEAAQERIREFEREREAFLMARQTGEATEADLRTLQAAEESLHDIPVMEEFLAAQAQLEITLQELNEELSAPLAIDFGEKASQCCAE